ncbi:hypothetical protein BDQ17DRAFT_1408459 [Cyathus striatus]|nr:hypothetical protein BDQ17DRAFT_1408459 [Cyathus striatus]
MPKRSWWRTPLFVLRTKRKRRTVDEGKLAVRYRRGVSVNTIRGGDGEGGWIRKWEGGKARGHMGQEGVEYKEQAARMMDLRWWQWTSGIGVDEAVRCGSGRGLSGLMANRQRRTNKQQHVHSPLNLMASTSQPIALPSHSHSHSSYDYAMAEGSYTSSGPFNPASYTRHFLGSPISWRASSFGAGSLGARFPPGSPTAALLNSIDTNDIRYGKSAESGSILNALNVFDREGELCRNYTCCGLHLNDLHALLEHFEEVHIVVLDPTAPQPQAHIQIPFNPIPIELPGTSQQHQQKAQQHAQQVAQQRAQQIVQACQMQQQQAQQQAQAQQQQQHQQQEYFQSLEQQQQLQHQQQQRTQGQYAIPFDPDEMELELDMDSSAHPPPPSTTHSSPSSGAPSPPDTPISTPLSAYPSPHPFVSHHLPQSSNSHLGLPSNPVSPYVSAPPSPLGTRQSSPTSTNGRPNLNLNLAGALPRGTINSPSIFSHPEDAFNSYARFSSDYSSCLPGAQYNASTADEAALQASAAQWPAQHGQQQQQQQQAGCVPPALLFSNSSTPISTPAESRVPSPTSAYQQGLMPPQTTQSMPTSPISTVPPSVPSINTAVHQPQGGSRTQPPTPSTTLSRPATSLLLSKPFKCPKPNCNKSYKQANGLKYHMTHGSCNFAPPKDLEHVKDLLERKRREAGLTRSASLNEGEKSFNYGELGQITETELREVEREAERRLRPFACGVGDCQRRYKNMNGLRYHYQHSGDHGAVGLALLASGQHECLSQGRKHHAANANANTPSAAQQQQTQQQLDDREEESAGCGHERAWVYAYPQQQGVTAQQVPVPYTNTAAQYGYDQQYAGQQGYVGQTYVSPTQTQAYVGQQQQQAQPQQQSPSFAQTQVYAPQPQRPVVQEYVQPQVPQQQQYASQQYDQQAQVAYSDVQAQAQAQYVAMYQQQQQQQGQQFGMDMS